MTVKELRQSGYKIKIFHNRAKCSPMLLDNGVKTFFGDVLPKGGRTELHLISPEGIEVVAEAKCSEKDNYCRKVGVAISLGRALKELEFQRKLESMKPKKEVVESNLLKRVADIYSKFKSENLDDVIQQEFKDRQFQRGRDYLAEVAERIIKKEHPSEF